MAREFHDLALLTAALELARDDRDQLATLTRATRRASSQLLPIVEEAIELGLVVESRERWELTPAGRSLGSSVLAAARTARTAARERYRPYDEYVPEGWSSDEV